MAYITLSEPFLYRGSNKPHKAGDIIQRPPLFDPEGLGNQVYASSNYWHAATYGLTGYGDSFIVQWNVNGKHVPAILLGLNENNADYFERIKQGTSFVAKVSIDTFSSSRCADETGKMFPAEWTSQKPVEALSVDVLKNDDIIRNGVQVFTTDKQIAKRIILGNGAPVTAKDIGCLVESGRVNWENLRPEYDNAPAARPDGIFERLGLQNKQTPPRPSSANTKRTLFAKNTM